MFIRRDRIAARRYTAVRVGLFFFAAGLWLAGVMVGNDLITAIAMVVAVGTLFFGMYLRRQAAREVEEEEMAAEDELQEGWER